MKRGKSRKRAKGIDSGGKVSGAWGRKPGPADRGQPENGTTDDRRTMDSTEGGGRSGSLLHRRHSRRNSDPERREGPTESTGTSEGYPTTN